MLLGVNPPKYPYSRVDLTFRVSAQLHDLLWAIRTEVGVTIQDYVMHCVLDMADAARQCPDWDTLPRSLIGDTPPHWRPSR